MERNVTAEENPPFYDIYIICYHAVISVTLYTTQIRSLV